MDKSSVERMVELTWFDSTTSQWEPGNNNNRVITLSDDVVRLTSICSGVDDENWVETRDEGWNVHRL